MLPNFGMPDSVPLFDFYNYSFVFCNLLTAVSTNFDLYTL